MTALTHNYNGFDISQESDGYTSLTDMAKAAGKLVADYLKTDSSQAYFQGLSDDMNIPISSLIRIVQGKGKVQGTWAHPEVAIDFAKWCNVSFRIWANRTLRGVIEGTAPQPRADRLIDARKIDLQISIKKLELELAKLELQRENISPQPIAPIQTELDLGIEQRYNKSKAALLAAKTLENEAKAHALTQKFAIKQKQDFASKVNAESIAVWANECIVLKPTAIAYIGNATGNPKTHLYPNYVNYCNQHYLEIVNMQAFSRTLAAFVQTTLNTRLGKSRDRIGCHLIGIAIAA